MGNWKQWLAVVLTSLFWAGWMSVLEIRRRKAAKIEPMKFGAIIPRWILPGLTFGFLCTFRWQAFHVPLVFLTVSIFVLDFATARIIRENPFDVFVRPVPYMKVTWMKASSFFLLMTGFASLLVPQAVPQVIGELFVVAGGTILMFDYFHSRRRKPR
jgi:hypothetical protein